MNYYLLIRNEVPDAVRFYALPEHEVRNYGGILDYGHGKVVNSDEDVEAAVQLLELTENAFEETVEVLDVLGRLVIETRQVPAGSWAHYEISISDLPHRVFLGTYLVTILL